MLCCQPCRVPANVLGKLAWRHVPRIFFGQVLLPCVVLGCVRCVCEQILSRQLPWSCKLHVHIYIYMQIATSSQMSLREGHAKGFVNRKWGVEALRHTEAPASSSPFSMT